MSSPIWNTPAGSLGTFSEGVSLSVNISASPLVIGDTLIYTLLNGKLPGTVTLDVAGNLNGVPALVNTDTSYEFTVRVIESNGILSDRTFSIVVTGADAPTWATPSGLLLTSNDSTWIEYQLSANANDPDVNLIFELSGGSVLPPGLEMNSAGLIRGYAVPPLLAAQTYTFTVIVTSISGSASRTFSIEILNQELNYVGVFPGRPPVILNDQPLTFIISVDDPYYSYYTSGSDIGKLNQDDDFIFKMIGYNFDTPPNLNPYENDLVYLITDTTPLGGYSSVITPSSLPGYNDTGWINAVLSHIGASIIQYQFDVTVYRASNMSLSSATKTFNFVLIGSVDESIVWITPSNLGSLNNGDISDLTIIAEFGSGITDGKYSLVPVVGEELPPGLQILSDGSISGRVEFDLAYYGEYVFTVEAYSELYPTLVTTLRQFTLNINQYYTVPYDNIYMQGLLADTDRLKIDGLLTYINTGHGSNIYRYTDPYFGVAKSVRYEHQYGVPSVSDISLGDANYFYNEYYSALQRNFYLKLLTLGQLKTAIARDNNGNIIYEVVYSEIIDDLVTDSGASISKKVGFRNPISTGNGSYWASWQTIYTSNTYYDLAPPAKQVVNAVLNSTTIELNNVVDLMVNMQITGFPGVVINNDTNGEPPIITAIDSSTNTIVVNIAQTISNKSQLIFNDPINTSSSDAIMSGDLYPNSLPNMREQIADIIGQIPDSKILPRWMTSQQYNGSVIGYTPCWVLCYTKPGASSGILDSIQAYLNTNNMVLNQITFEVDRIEIDRTLTYTWGSLSYDQWPPTQPSDSVNNNSQDRYINFPKRNILY